MSEMKRSRSIFDFKAAKIGPNESSENLIPALPAPPAASTSQSGQSSKGPGLLRKVRSMIGQSKAAPAAPDAMPPTDVLPKSLKAYADMVPGAGSRDRTTMTPPNSPTGDTHGSHALTFKDSLPVRPAHAAKLDGALSALNASRTASDLNDMMGGRTPPEATRGNKIPPRYTHTPREPGTSLPPGQGSASSSVKLQERRLPDSKPASKVVGPEKPQVQGMLTDSRGNLDKKGREAMPQGKPGTKKLAKMDKDKGGPSVS